jgi:hypothetical protein
LRNGATVITKGDDKEQRADDVGNRPQAGPDNNQTGHD